MSNFEIIVMEENHCDLTKSGLSRRSRCFDILTRITCGHNRICDICKSTRVVFLSGNLHDDGYFLNQVIKFGDQE